jgi:hypothetical protein
VVVVNAAYDALVDRLAADSRETADQLDGPEKVLWMAHSRLTLHLLTDLLAHEDPVLSMRAYRDQLAVFLSTQDDV